MIFRTLPALRLPSMPAWAGPPFVTDDPEPADFGHAAETGRAAGYGSVLFTF